MLSPVEYLALGAKGQFFVRFKDKDYCTGSLSVEDNEFLARVLGELVSVHFARQGLIARYAPFDGSLLY